MIKKICFMFFLIFFNVSSLYAAPAALIQSFPPEATETSTHCWVNSICHKKKDKKSNKSSKACTQTCFAGALKNILAAD